MNEKGFFHDLDFEELLDDCPEWMPKYPGKDLCDYDKLRELIRNRCKEHEQWGLKITLGAFIVDEIEKYSAVKLIVLQRNRQASIDSLAKWSMTHDQEPEEVIDRAQDAINKVSRGRGVLTVSFADVLNDPDSFVKTLAEFVEKPQSIEAVSFVSPALKHY